MTQSFSKIKRKFMVLILLFALFGLAFIASIVFGQTPVSFQEALSSFTNYNEESTEHIIIQTDRLPRAIIGTVIGASLAIAGALMQALTKNPLASPSIFGINHGAIFFVVVGVVFFSISSLIHLTGLAFLGAAVAAFIVYFLGSLGRNGLTPIKIVLAGAAISALFQSYTQAMLVLNETGLQDVLFWLAGSISGRTLDMLVPVLPFIGIAMMVAMFMGKAINLMTTGDDIAKGMGQNVVLVKGLMGILVVLLAGSSVAVVGSVGFIGLVIPHIARFFAGNDYRWVIPFSALLGAVLLIAADVLARILIMPQEVPLGVMTALVGGPFFVYLARRGVSKL
ncbi:iron ABC transporter permease [Alteribacillus sp. YIM 98480]|uniref:FecCD family ABC transporter permease n=1 Tax=Alteribacillus sp. YIM 98480 TaxID=2606599 RepID=UPI00131AD9DE